MTYLKEIVYDREIRDYAMYLDGELTGFGRTYHEAEVQLDELVFELMSGQYFAGGSADPPTPLPDDLPEPGPGGPGVPGDERPYLDLLDDIRNVLDMALGYTSGATSVIGELRRVRARIDHTCTSY